MRLRSVLLVAPTHPELVLELPGTRPDACIIDLEESVPADRKAEARWQVRVLAELLAEQGAPVFVRINEVDSEWFDDDVSEALTPALTGVVVPHLGHRGLATLRRALAERGLSGLLVIAGVDNPAELPALRAPLAPVDAVYFDGESPAARSYVAMAAEAAGVTAIDQPLLDYAEGAFQADAQHARDLGFGGKLCVHPQQVAAANLVFGSC